MRAVGLVEVGTPLADVDTELPVLAPHDVRVTIEAAGICHSDVHYRSGTRSVPGVPITPGHEISGTMAEALGATPIPFKKAHRIEADVALELVGLPETMKAAVQCLGVRGRAVAVGITDDTFPLDSFQDLVLKEAETLGAADHLASEIEELIAMVDDGKLDLSDIVTGTVPLEAGAINAAMDRLESFGGGVRTVITPMR